VVKVTQVESVECLSYLMASPRFIDVEVGTKC